MMSFQINKSKKGINILYIKKLCAAVWMFNVQIAAGKILVWTAFLSIF